MDQGKRNTKEGKWKQLNERDRYEIEALLKAKHSVGEIAAQLQRDRRTIEREIARGSVVQRRANPCMSRNPAVPEYLEERVYCADAGQRVHAENISHKGRGLKIGHDHALAAYLEEKIGKEKYSPDAAIGEIKAKGLTFSVSICTKTVYNYLDIAICGSIGMMNWDGFSHQARRFPAGISRIFQGEATPHDEKRRPRHMSMLPQIAIMEAFSISATKIWL